MVEEFVISGRLLDMSNDLSLAKSLYSRCAVELPALLDLNEIEKLIFIRRILNNWTSRAPFFRILSHIYALSGSCQCFTVHDAVRVTLTHEGEMISRQPETIWDWPSKKHTYDIFSLDSCWSKPKIPFVVVRSFASLNSPLYQFFPEGELVVLSPKLATNTAGG